MAAVRRRDVPVARLYNTDNDIRSMFTSIPSGRLYRIEAAEAAHRRPRANREWENGLFDWHC